MSNEQARPNGTSRLHGKPERIFVSVDQSTNRSAVSFHPVGVGEPILYDDDHTGAMAIREAKAISNMYPGSTVLGPHFHGARPAGRKRGGRKS